MPQDVVPYIASIAAVVATLVGIITSAKKGELEVLKAALDELQEENKRMAERLREAEKTVEILRKDMDELNHGVGILINQIKGLGHQPAWMPRGFSTAQLTEKRKPAW